MGYMEGRKLQCLHPAPQRHQHANVLLHGQTCMSAWAGSCTVRCSACMGKVMHGKTSMHGQACTGAWAGETYRDGQMICIHGQRQGHAYIIVRPA